MVGFTIHVSGGGVNYANSSRFYKTHRCVRVVFLWGDPQPSRGAEIRDAWEVSLYRIHTDVLTLKTS